MRQTFNWNLCGSDDWLAGTYIIPLLFAALGGGGAELEEEQFGKSRLPGHGQKKCCSRRRRRRGRKFRTDLLGKETMYEIPFLKFKLDPFQDIHKWLNSTGWVVLLHTPTHVVILCNMCWSVGGVPCNTYRRWSGNATRSHCLNIILWRERMCVSPRGVY